jgi:hypothetical protein
MPFIDNPGLSIVAFDPGGTTGVAVWDAYTQELFVDQIDAGRGRKTRLTVWPNKVESPRRERVLREARKGGVDVGLGHGIETEMEIMHRTEAGVVQVMLDLVMAAGPRTVVVTEDYVIGHGDPDAVKSSKREGLSPVPGVIGMALVSVVWMAVV